MFLPVPTWLLPSAPPIGLAANLRLILENLRATAGLRASADRAAAPLALLLSAYLSSVIRRFESLVARHAAGRLVTRPARPRPIRPQIGRPQDDPGKPRLPRRNAWLIGFLPYRASAYAAQLRHILVQNPELIALMAASPQAGRILRPLCRMLGMDPGPDLPPSLFPPVRPSNPRRRAAVVATIDGGNGAGGLKAWRDAARVARRLARQSPRPREHPDILPGYSLKPA